MARAWTAAKAGLALLVVLTAAAAIARDDAPTAAAPLVRSGGGSVAEAPAAAMPAAVTGPRWFGTLLSRQDHATAEKKGGVRVAMTELSWREYEPRRGVFDAGYAAYVRSELATFRAAGRRVTLGLGLSDPPSWVFGIANSRFVDEHGNRSHEVNLVFNQLVRQAAEQYLARVARDLHMRDVWAVRLTSGGGIEMLYPGDSYWAFDANAQNGPHLPPSMPRNPLRGWRPGNRSVTTVQVQSWADWYVRALDDVAAWQMRTIDKLGFRGWYQVLTPGSGVRPDGYRSDVAAYLPDGLTGAGAVWSVFYAHLPNRGRVMAYITSMADGSGGDDTCQPADRSLRLTDRRADSWSATRWISRIADQYGLAKSGENPGWNFPPSLNGHYKDPGPSGMMHSAVRQMVLCGFQGMYWAHDQQLWDGTSSFARYSALIKRTNKDDTNALPRLPG